MVRALVALSNFCIASTFGGCGNGVDGEGLRGRFFIFIFIDFAFFAQEGFPLPNLFIIYLNFAITMRSLLE